MILGIGIVGVGEICDLIFLSCFVSKVPYLEVLAVRGGFSRLFFLRLVVGVFV